VKLIVVKLGGSIADEAAARLDELLASGHALCIVHGAGPQISREMERAGVPVEFRDGRRVTTPAGIAIVAAALRDVNAAVCAAVGERAVPLYGEEIGLEASPVAGLGLVGDPLPCAPAAILDALERGLVPVVSPLAAGPLNVNADEAAAALAVGLAAQQLLFLTDVPGLILAGVVVEQIELEAARDLLAGGTLEGGIIPKLGAAVTAASGGVPASIGRTAVAA
jgi:acetylglutamate kinase